MLGGGSCLYKVMGANLQSDFLSRPVQPGEPMPSETTIQGWLAARSRVQLYHNHVRWAWQTAGIWDAFIAGKHDEARAECGLAGTAPALNQTFAQHQAPSALELQHSVLYDHRWADAEKMQHRVVNKHLQNLQVFAQKNMFMISKKQSIKTGRICGKKCNIVIRQSKNTSFTHV